MSTEKEIFGLSFTVFGSELELKDFKQDAIQRTAKCLKDFPWLWRDIKQIDVHETSWSSEDYEVMIIFNNFYKLSDLEFFIKSCRNFGTDSVWPMEVP